MPIATIRGNFSVKAITDPQWEIIDIFVGYPGCVHDARVLTDSPVYTVHLYPPAEKQVWGDCGYPSLSDICLITPYRRLLQNPEHFT